MCPHSLPFLITVNIGSPIRPDIEHVGIYVCERSAKAVQEAPPLIVSGVVRVQKVLPQGFGSLTWTGPLGSMLVELVRR